MKRRVIRPLNTRACRGEEDSYSLLHVDPVNSNLTFLFCLFWIHHVTLTVVYRLPLPLPLFCNSSLTSHPTCATSRDSLSDSVDVMLCICVCTRAVPTQRDVIFLYVTLLCLYSVLYTVEAADLSCSVMFTLSLFSVCSLPYPCLLLWCCRAWDLWKAKILSLNDWGR